MSCEKEKSVDLKGFRGISKEQQLIGESARNRWEKKGDQWHRSDSKGDFY